MSALRLHYATAATQRSRVAVASTQRCVSCTATTSSSSRLVWQTVSKCERQARASSATVRAKNEPVVEDYDPEMDCEERMDKSVSSCQTELAGFRTGRAQPAMLSTVQVDYYGAPTSLQSLATVTTPDAQTLMINPFDKSSINTIEVAINTSGLGFTCGNDGKVIRINIPALTEDRRKEMAKLCSKTGEEAKVAIRNVRRDALKQAEKLDLPEDQKKSMETDVQKITDSYIKKVDEMIAGKVKEITTV